MYPLVWVLLGAMILAGSFAVTIPRQADLLTQTNARTEAANFWAYRDALIAYKNKHPDIPSGTAIAYIDSPHIPVGYIHSDSWPITPGIRWNNIVQDGLLYVYSSNAASTLPASVVDDIANRHGRSLMIGIAAPAGHTMTSIFRYKRDERDPTQTYAEGPVVFSDLPAIIPAGALVVVGN